MKRLLWLFLCGCLILAPSWVPADSRIGFGAALDAFIPYDTQMYGARMLDKDWGKILNGEGNTPHYLTPSRENMIFSPMLFENYTFDFGLCIQFAQQVQYLNYAPSRSVDVSYQHFSVPLRLSAMWVFNRQGRYRPFFGGGGSYTYGISLVSGNDLADRYRNPAYDQAGGSDAPEFITVNHKWGISGWYPGFHGIAGIKTMFRDDFGLMIAARYEVLFYESVDAALVVDGDDERHWKKGTHKGDAGGVGVSFGITYEF